MRYILVILAAFGLLLAGCTGSGTQQAAQAPANAASMTPPATGQQASAPGTATPQASGSSTEITKAELAKHSSEPDCWVGYDGKVYDITGFLPKHKNYQQLLVPLCGTSDKFAQMFEGKHGLSKVSVLEGLPMMGALSAQ